MKNRITLLLTFLAAFLIMTPVWAETTGGDTSSAPAEDSTAAAASSGGEGVVATEAKAEEKASGGEEAKAEDAKVEGPAELKSDEEAMSAVAALIDAAKKGHWSLVAALAIMLVVFGLKRSGLLEKLGSKALPWVAAGTGVLGYLAAYLMVPGSSVATALVGGLMASAMASGLWEMLFKHLLGSKTAV